MVRVSQNVVRIPTVRLENLFVTLTASARTVVVKVQNVPDMTDHVMNPGNRETTTVNTVTTWTPVKRLGSVSQVVTIPTTCALAAMSAMANTLVSVMASP